MKSLMQRAIQHQREKLGVASERTNKKFCLEWDVSFLERFVQEKCIEEKYTQLFRYFVTGMQVYISVPGSRVYYPGFPSNHGLVVDGLEGFSRILPLLSIWLASGRTPSIQMLDGRDIDLREIVTKGIKAGVTPGFGFWGEASDFCQRIVEAHDIAIATWLLRDQLSNLFRCGELQALFEWLERVAEKKCVDNNWHLFMCIIDAVLLSSGRGGSRARLVQHFSRIKSFYLTCGWFKDGPEGEVDFYNIWGIHYSLFWLQEIMPDFEKEFIDGAREKFFDTYQYLITPNGAPLFGRSMIYRLALSTPYLIAAHHKIVSLGIAKRAFDSTWNHYVQHGALQGGKLTQGIFLDNPAIVDHYSAPASPLWGLRSFILALLFGKGSDFWTCPLGLLPIERGDYVCHLPEIGWIIKGDLKTQTVTIVRKGGKELKEILFERRTLRKYLEEIVTGRAVRPVNPEIKCSLREYSSDKKVQARTFKTSYIMNCERTRRMRDGDCDVR